MVTWSRVSSSVKPSFPRKVFPRDSGNTGNERKSQTWRRELPVLWGLQTCFCSKTTINMASMVSVSFRSIFFLVWLDLEERKMSLTTTGPTERWNEDHVWCSSDTDNNLANYSAKRRVAKGKLQTKAAFYWKCLSTGVYFSPSKHLVELHCAALI